MKDIHVYIHLPNYVRQWLEHRFGSPVRFGRNSPENFLLTSCVRRPPLNAVVRSPEDNCAIVLPDNAVRRPETYHYLGRRSKAKLSRHIEQLFLLSLWTSCIQYVSQPRQLTPAIEMWCKSNGISCQYEEAVRQKFYRLRSNYSTHGIVLGKKYKKKTS